jgi:hypothetical protein
MCLESSFGRWEREPQLPTSAAAPIKEFLASRAGDIDETEDDDPDEEEVTAVPVTPPDPVPVAAPDPGRPKRASAQAASSSWTMSLGRGKRKAPTVPAAKPAKVVRPPPTGSQKAQGKRKRQ